MEESTEFPKFKCLITDAMEEYDSGVWEFFRHYDSILSEFGQLMLTDGEWKDNYLKLIRYYSDLGSAIILKRKAPDPGFMTGLISTEIENTDPEDVLLRATNTDIGFLLKLGAELEKLMGEYVRLSKTPRFAESFAKDKFEGIRLLARAVYSRGVNKSKR